MQNTNALDIFKILLSINSTANARVFFIRSGRNRTRHLRTFKTVLRPFHRTGDIPTLRLLKSQLVSSVTAVRQRSLEISFHIYALLFSTPSG